MIQIQLHKGKEIIYLVDALVTFRLEAYGLRGITPILSYSQNVMIQIVFEMVFLK